MDSLTIVVVSTLISIDGAIRLTEEMQRAESKVGVVNVVTKV